MKYFTYISLTKIEMLYSQIERETSEREASLGFDIKILKGELKEKIVPADSTYKKLVKVTDKLAKLGVVGALDSGKGYIHGTLELKFGGYGFEYTPDPVGSEHPIAFWGGSNFEPPYDRIALALAGSNYHLIGSDRRGSADSHSLTPAMIGWFLNNLDDKFENAQRQRLKKAAGPSRGGFQSLKAYDVANGTYLAATQMYGESAKYEFFAKVLHRSEWPEGFRFSNITKILLGSPLYVCLVD